MIDPLEMIRKLIHCPADAVRWACVLEATAPKAGNVYPGRSFEDLTYGDFMAAAEIAADSLADSTRRVSLRMVDAVQRTAEATGTNVNLGIVLLLGPLVAADEAIDLLPADARVITAWKDPIDQLLRAMDAEDAGNIFRAIAQASAGGLGAVERMDVNDDADPPADLLHAMRFAQSYDRIAVQYATGFSDLMHHVVPVVRTAIADSGDLLAGIALAHLRLLAMAPDSLIARKNGVEVARSVQQRAREVNTCDASSVAQFDASLRTAGNPLNPGTTADLIAAALYMLLRCT